MRLKQGILISCTLLAAFSGGYMFHAATSSTASQEQISVNDYPLLARRIFVENPNDSLVNFASLRQQFQAYFNDNKLRGSLYFEYLPTGTSARITADDQQVAASLMKLPAAMDAMRAIETGKISADHPITLEASWLDAGYGDLYKKGAGYTLTLNQAIEIMLTNSDNTALKAVGYTTMNLVPKDNSVLKVVDIDLTQNTDLTVSIGTRSYASFLKCLYFACYNNRDDSNQLLTYLSKTPFKNRLVAGIADTSVIVAHKIGVYDNVQSDCGIVYIPNRQYLICAMINGPDNDGTNAHIAALSKLAYEYIKHQ